MSSEHDSEVEHANNVSPVGNQKVSGTDRKISAERASDRAVAAARFHRIARQEGWSDAAIAKRLGCSEGYVGMLRNGQRTLEAGHLERLGTLRIAYLRAALEEAETAMPQTAQDAERLALRLGAAAGKLQDAVLRGTADGELDDSERTSICGHASELDDLVHQTRRTIGGQR
jgi:transcriptional regulator with XRE-family HTH domain